MTEIILKPEVFHASVSESPVDSFWKQKFQDRSDTYILGQSYGEEKNIHYLGSLMMAAVKNNSTFLEWFTSNVFHELGHALMEYEATTSAEEDWALWKMERHVWDLERW